MAVGEISDIRPIARMSTVLESDARKFEYFCDAICGVYCGIQPEQSTDQVFNADFSAHVFTGAVLATIASPGHKARRDTAMIRKRPDDNLFLNFAAFSTFSADHAGGEWKIRPATPFLLDNEQPFDLDFDRSRRMHLYSLRLSKAGRRFTPETLRRVNLAIASTPTGRQLGLQMRLMCEAAEAGNMVLADLMNRPVQGLLSILLDAGSEADDGNHRLEEIKSVARCHLEDPDFSLDHLARLFRCSTRTLQGRFAAGDERFSSWLLAARLDLARDRLLSPAFAGRSIETVALSAGFRDASHFHRAFRQRFSLPPGAMRH